ncbi:MAG: hypothetical protein ACTSSH_12330 [Candidatus Heimdallarchaeota archaeon]
MSTMSVYKIRGMNSESDTLLDDYWEVVKKVFRRNILISAIFVPFSLCLVPMFLVVRGRVKRQYNRVKDLAAENKVLELLKFANSSIPEEFNMSLMCTYALVDLKYYPVKESIEFRLDRLELTYVRQNRDELLAHYKALLKRVEKFEDKEREQLEPLVPNEGALVEEYWREIKKRSTLVLIITGIFLPFLLISLIPFLITRRNYKRILQLRKARDEKALGNMIRSSSALFGSIVIQQTVMALCALADLRSDITLENTKFLLAKMAYSPSEKIVRERVRLQRMLTYLDDVEKASEEEKADDSIIEIAKIYFVDKAATKGEKCMITGLVLDFDKDDILVCPKCRNYGKRGPMEKWLAEKEKCPRCRRKLTKEECPKVMIQENRK